MLRMATVGHFRFKGPYLVWDDPLEQTQTILNQKAREELFRLLDSQTISGVTVVSSEDSFPELQNLGVLQHFSNEPPNTECTVLDMWPDTPPLARDYAFASGVRSDETIAQLDEHHQHLREKLALTGPPHHVWENPIFAKQELNLPHGETISYTRSFKSVLNSRKSARFTNTELKSISLRSLASILYDSASFSKRPTTNEQKSGNIHFRSAPSAGGLCSTELIVRVSRCDSIDDGYYLYHPKNHSLLFLNHLEPYKEWKTAVGKQSHVVDAPIHFITVGDPRVISWKYESLNSVRTLWLEIGHLSQVIQMVATATDHLSRGISLFREDIIADNAGLDWRSFLWGMLIAVGPRDD